MCIISKHLPLCPRLKKPAFSLHTYNNQLQHILHHGATMQNDFSSGTVAFLPMDSTATLYFYRLYCLLLK